VLVTPAPLAAWIVFSNDLPAKVHAWLHQRSPPESDIAGRPPPPPGDEPMRKRPTPRTGGRMPRDGADVAESSADAAEDVVASTPRVVEPTPPVSVEARSSEPAAALEIALELSANKQVHVLAPDAGGPFKVLGLTGCPATYAIDAADATLDGRRRATIRIDGPRPIAIELSLPARGSGPRAIVVEPTIATDHGKTIPFTLPRLEDYERDVTNLGSEAVAHLAALEAERARLQRFIRAPMAKPLAARGEARAAVMQLDYDIAAQRQLITTLEQDLQVANTVVDFARQMKKDCRIQLGAP
jgi:hypothetical protein